MAERNIEDLLNQQQVSLKSYFDQQLAVQFRMFEGQISTALQNSIASVSKELQSLNDRTLRLEDYCYSAVSEAQDAKQQVHVLSERLDSVCKYFEDKLDRMEAHSRRDNLRFFNVPQAHEESYTECAQTALSMLKDAMPEVNWHQDDVVRAHRIGRYSPNQSHPKPLIVRFTRWSDKMMILTRGKESLRKKGISVAGDLTDRQRQTLEEHRQQGLRAYFRGNRLFIAGPLRNNNRPGYTERRDDQNHNTNAYPVNHWQNTQYQPLPTHQFPPLPQRQHERPSVTHNGISNDRSARSEVMSRRHIAADNGSKDTGSVHAESLPLPHTPSTPRISRSISDTDSTPPHSSTVPQTTELSSEQVSVPRSPTIPEIVTAQVDGVPLPLSPTIPEMFVETINEQVCIPPPHSPFTPNTSDETSDQVSTCIPHSPSTPQATDDSTILVKSSHVQPAARKKRDKTNRGLRSASVTSTDSKRQMTISETVSKSGDRQRVQSKQTDK